MLFICECNSETPCRRMIDLDDEGGWGVAHSVPGYDSEGLFMKHPDCPNIEPTETEVMRTAEYVTYFDTTFVKNGVIG